jgi:hypothetical protein
MGTHLTVSTHTERGDGLAEATIAFVPIGSLGVPNSDDAVSVSVVVEGCASDALSRAWELTATKWPVLFTTSRPSGLVDGTRFEAERVHCPPPIMRHWVPDFAPLWKFEDE